MSYQKHNFTPGAVLLASQLNDMDNQIEILSESESDMSDAFKTALLECFENVAWINEQGQTYYNNLYNALYPYNTFSVTNVLNGCTTSNNSTNVRENSQYVAIITPNEGYSLDGATVNISMGGNNVTNLYYSNGSINIPNVTGDLVITVTATSSVTSISAVFTQGSTTIYDFDTLDTLKQYLTVTANYADSTTATVTDYTLSGTLTEGTSIITVTYGGKTDTFNVTVTHGTLMFVGASYGAGQSGGTITFNTDESVTLITTGNASTWGLCYSPYGNASAFSTWGSLKGHTVRAVCDIDWKSTTETAHLVIAAHLTNDLSTYNGARLKNSTITDNQRTNVNTYYDFVVPSTASGWGGGSGTPTDNSYFSFRAYLLSNTAGANVVLKLKFYDLGVV